MMNCRASAQCNGTCLPNSSFIISHSSFFVAPDTVMKDEVAAAPAARTQQNQAETFERYCRDATAADRRRWPTAHEQTRRVEADGKEHQNHVIGRQLLRA